MTLKLNENIHLLLPKSEVNILRRRAQSEKKPVAELIRRAIRKVYGTPELGLRRQAFERLAAHSELDMEDWEVVKKELLRRYD